MLAEDMINTLNKTQGENEMTTMLPDNTVQIDPQGEIEGLGFLSLEDLHKLFTAARDLYERKTDEHKQQMWDNVVKAVKEYCEEYGNIVILCDSDDSLEFNHNQMDCRGEIDCE
jgi:catalase